MWFSRLSPDDIFSILLSMILIFTNQACAPRVHQNIVTPDLSGFPF